MKRLQIILMILALGLFLVPKQLLATSSAMDCCTSEQMAKNHCQHTKKDNHHQSGDHKNCTGSSCTTCGTCTVFSISVLKADFIHLNSIATKIKSGQSFIYKEPALQNGICEIWQPPKIG